jgi:cytochrome c oxidase subunit 4
MADAAHPTTDHAHAHGAPHVHPASIPSLLGTFVALLILTGLTWFLNRWVGFMNVPRLDIYIALLIASVKALLVCLFFMHMIHDKFFNAVVFIASLLFLLLFLALAYLDSSEYQKDIKDMRQQQLEAQGG